MSLSGRHILAGALAIVVASAIGMGIALLGPPSQERARRLDDRRVEELRRISSSVHLFHTRHDRLPASREELSKEPGVILETRDPVTDEPYGYRVVDSMTYELCAIFDRESTESRASFWSHGAGKQCFTLKAEESR